MSGALHLPPQQQQQQRIQPYHQQEQQAMAPLAINTKVIAPTTTSGSNSASIQQSPSSSRTQQQQTVTQLADFAAHMVCYLLYGHQHSKSRGQSHVAGTPPSSIPSSPMTGLSHSTSSCPCEVCNNHNIDNYSTSRSSPPPVYQTSTWQHQQQPLNRPTHRRIMSESDIVQPKPMFRKFCLDVLSATLLSSSVILLSLKYIQQLMINLKESNKIVNTGEGAEYRFFTGALILANKFLDDNTFTNKTWADITGMKIKDVNHLEMQFLNGIDFRLFTSPSHYFDWLATLTRFTGTYMPSQHHVAYQQQTAAAQSPISPMDQSGMMTEIPSGVGRYIGTASSLESGSGTSRHTQSSASMSLSMTSISQYIDSVKQIQQATGFSSRYQRVPAASSYHSAPTPRHNGSTNIAQPTTYVGTCQGPSSSFSPSPLTMAYAAQPKPTASLHRKRSANIAFDDVYESGLLPHSTHAPVVVPTHKRFSSSSSVSTLMGLNSSQDMFHGGQSPLPPQQQHRQSQRSHPSMMLSHRASSGALSTAFRGHHQRSASGSYYVDMSGYSSYQDPSHVTMSMPNSFSRSGAVHPLDDTPDQGHHSASRPTTTYRASQSMQRASQATRVHSMVYRPSTPPQYSPNKCEPSWHPMECGSNVGANAGAAYDVDPRLWGPLDSLSLYAITTQAAKRVVAQGKALSASANGLHMYYPTTLA
ncbi:hypothetical protein BG011_003806 [Mortierella polycephala]|uniref:Cyclin-domain-containing protein n=1 Tax=Mortierella polycephala TaxID=41804 RepID=A0A9P6Q1G3_9FUNG|nr:hypothetical protein BG011_003806 [Mortierella polycephala]